MHSGERRREPGDLNLSKVGKRLLLEAGLGWDKKDFDLLRDGDPRAIPIWRHKQMEQLYAVNARMNPWAGPGCAIRPLDPTFKPLTQRRRTANAATMRDFRLVAPATEQLLGLAAGEGFHSVSSMLLAAGEHRTFPQAVALQEMVRGWQKAAAAVPATPSLEIFVHHSAAQVLVEIESGRLDLAGTRGTLVFWLDIEMPLVHRRHLCLRSPADSLRGVAEDFALTGDGWSIDVSPSPSAEFAHWTLEGVAKWEEVFGAESGSMTLERFGLLPGSILTFVKDSG